MVIFFVTSNFDTVVNGPAKFAKFLAQLDPDPSTDVHILTEDILDLHNRDQVHPVALDLSFPRSYVSMLSRNLDYLRTIRTLILEGLFPDIIVFNNCIYGLLCARYLSVPVIGMINDDSSLLASFARYGLSYKFFRQSTFGFLEKRAIAVCDAIIVNSNYLKLLVEQFGHAGSNIFTLYKSIDCNISSLTSACDYSQTIRVLFVKSDYVRGGLFDLITALNLIPATTFELTVAGPPADIVLSDRDLPTVEPHLTLKLAGPLPQDQVYALLRQSHIFCTPAHLEALGVANMEALLHGTPVVYTSVGGVPEVMDYGNNGFASEPHHPIALAHSISMCITDEILREKKRNAGLAYVRSHFVKEAMLTNFLQICRRVYHTSSKANPRPIP